MNRDPNALLAKMPWLAALCQPSAHSIELSSACGGAIDLSALDAALSGLDLTTFVPLPIRRAVRHRQLAWLGGRVCAERALQLLGVSSCSVPRGAEGEPVWPPGVAGSITHADSSAHALVVRRSDQAGIGIDSERVIDPATQQAVAAVCCSPSEQTAWLQGPDALAKTTVLFASKEAFYKAAWPALRRFIDFDEVEAHSWQTAQGRVLLRTTGRLPRAEFAATYCLDEARSMVHVSVHLEASLVARLAQTRPDGCAVERPLRVGGPA